MEKILLVLGIVFIVTGTLGVVTLVAQNSEPLYQVIRETDNIVELKLRVDLGVPTDRGCEYLSELAQQVQNNTGKMVVFDTLPKFQY